MRPDANSPEVWGERWINPKGVPAHVLLRAVHERVAELVPQGARVVDVGGGAGHLGRLLVERCAAVVTVWEHNEPALEAARAKGLGAVHCDLRQELPEVEPGAVVVATEVLEHLELEDRRKIYRRALQCVGLVVSVPDDRAGPGTIPGHVVQFTPVSFLAELTRELGGGVQVERIGRYGQRVPKDVRQARYRGHLLAYRLCPR